MEDTKVNKKEIFTWKHYLFLAVWWLSLGFALDTNSAVLGLVLSFLFFAVTSIKVVKKSILIMLIVFVVTAIFPPLGLVVGILALIFFLLRITFVIENWRALTVGLYAYGIYLLVVVFNAFFYETIVVQATVRIVDFFSAGGETAVETFGQQGVDAVNATTAFMKEAIHVGAYVFPLFLAFGFHRLLGWLYKHGYSTNRAFQVIGLTPLVVMAIVLPFLKIDLGGDTLFAGSLADGTDGVSGLDGVDTTINLPHVDLPEQVTTIVDVANVDVSGWFVDNAADFSPAIESAMATMAVRGIYAVDDRKGFNNIFQTNFNGQVQTVREYGENHRIVTDEHGRPVAEIIHDATTNQDRARFGEGQEIYMDNDTGHITDFKGKMVAKIKEVPGGGKILVTNDERIIRRYEQDGRVRNGQGEIVGEVQLAV